MSFDSVIFIIVEAVFLLGVVIALYTRVGSGISETPYNKIYGGAPGARGRSELSGRDPLEELNWSRGTR